VTYACRGIRIDGTRRHQPALHGPDPGARLCPNQAQEAQTRKETQGSQTKVSPVFVFPNANFLPDITPMRTVAETYPFVIH